MSVETTIPEGLALQPNIISVEKEKEIIEWLDSREWSNELSRRTQHYGYGYNYKHKDLIPGPPLEGPILKIAQIIEKAGLMKPVQCIVNEYYRNQGIAPHIDNLAFGPVVIGISLGADGVMTFERGNEIFEFFLPQRYEWKHGINKRVTYIDNHGKKVIKSQDYRRISLTFRELAK